MNPLRDATGYISKARVAVLVCLILACVGGGTWFVLTQTILAPKGEVETQKASEEVEEGSTEEVEEEILADEELENAEDDSDVDTSAVGKWLEDIEGSELLSEDFDKEELAELYPLYNEWSDKVLKVTDPDISIPMKPFETERGTAFYLRIETKRTLDYALAQLSDAGDWSITRVQGTVEGLNDKDDGSKHSATEPDDNEKMGGVTLDADEDLDGQILISQYEAIAKVTSEDIAKGIARGVGDSGIENARAAYTMIDTIKTKGDVTELTVYFPVYIAGGEDTQAYACSYDSAADTFSIEPIE